MSSRWASIDDLLPPDNDFTKMRAPRGNTLSCKGWQQEAALRLLMNNIEQAERPDELIVYGGNGKAARNKDCFWEIARCLRTLENDETLLVQSGKPVGIWRTHSDAPRVLIANANIVPEWANDNNFERLRDKLNVTMYGQMTAGSWIYIGTQGILQGTYLTFREAAKRHFGGTLKGRLVLTAGLGGMGGAQPLAVTMNGGVCLVIEVDQERIKKRLDTKYLDEQAENLDEALRIVQNCLERGEPRSIAVLGNAADILTEIVRRGIRPDIVTDQTAASDLESGYTPTGYTVEEAAKLRETDPHTHRQRVLDSIKVHVTAMLDFHEMRDSNGNHEVIVFDYGNGIRARAKECGLDEAMTIPGFVPEYIRPLFCEGKGPFRWVALSGDPDDIERTDEVMLELFAYDADLVDWITKVKRLPLEKLPGLPSRICWLGYGERERAGLAFNDLVRRGELKAPIAIGRDHLDGGSVASPYRETEGMKDHSDEIADWPILNALLNTASGASWVSFHHGGGVGIGKSLHAGMVIVADGSDAAIGRLSRVLTNDPGTAIMRHVDAQEPLAVAAARKHRIVTPMPRVEVGMDR